MTGYEHYKPRTHLSVSSLCAFARCPRRYFYSSGCRLSAGEHVALKFGESIHAALPYAAQGLLEKAISEFKLVWKDTLGDDKRNLPNACTMLHAFVQSHTRGRSIYTITPPPAGVLKIEDAVSEWEVPFALDIGLPVPLVGRVDCLGWHRDTHEPWAIEWKTSSEMSSRFFDSFTFNPQVCAYALALRSYGVNVTGTIVEAIKVAKSNPSESLPQPIFVTQQMVDDFIRWAQWVGTQILACESQREFPKDISACTTYPQFGQVGYQCEYQQMCLVGDWTSLKQMYTVKDDRPFKLVPLTVEITK